MRTCAKILVPVLAVSLAGVAAGQDTAGERGTLAGLRGVGAQVNLTASESANLSSQTIQTDIELKLRQSGIRVFTPDELLKVAGYPYLTVNVMVFGHSSIRNLVAFHVSVSFVQSVALNRNRLITYVEGTTWSGTPWLGISGQDRLDDAVRGKVRDAVDQFINAYLAVNPTR